MQAEGAARGKARSGGVLFEGQRGEGQVTKTPRARENEA